MSLPRSGNGVPATVRRILLAAVLSTTPALLLTAPPSAEAQETTAQITGVVQSSEGTPITGARVTITHVPTGSSQTVQTNAQGRFVLAGLRPGGPYTVSVQAEGYEATTAENQFTRIAQPLALNVALQPALEEVIVAGTRRQELGVSSRFDAEQIANLPTINRDIKDIVRADALASLDPANVFALSIAGQNNRFNSLTVDGVRQNDDFGLNQSGYATNRTPVALDAIDQLSLLVSPWDVQYSGFTGGSINVVTKSGTNDFSGSAYYYYGDDGLAGSRSKNRPIRLAFEEKTVGGTFGGPILRDRLFFFLSYEQLTRTTPVDFGPGGSGFGSVIAPVTTTLYEQLRTISQRVYNFDPGEYRSSVPEEAERMLANLDWTINDAHRARLSFQRTEDFDTTGFTTIGAVAGVPRLNAPSYWYERGYKLDQVVAQLFSTWTDALSTELRVARKKVANRQEPLGGLAIGEFRVQGFNGAPGPTGEVYFGPDGPRHANVLRNETDQIRFRAQYLAGDHTLSAGIEWEKLDVFNLFVNGSRGVFTFPSLAAFEARNASILNYTNAITNDANDAAAKFAYSTTSLYLQDRWQITPEFLLSLGLRYERISSSDRPRSNPAFLARYGFANNETYDGRDLLLPRVGFEWEVTPRTTISGGVGLFGGGSPNVWLSNSYSNDGITVANVSITPTATSIPQAVRDAALTNVTGQIPLAVRQYLATLQGTGTVNAVDPNFDLPSSWRYQFGVKQRADLPWLGDDWNFSATVTYTDVVDAVLWKDLRLIQIGTLPDGRPRYGFRATDAATLPGRGLGTQDLLLTNTSDGKSMALALEAAKTWETRAGAFDLSIAYAYTDATDVSPATSSIAASNWNNVAVSDVNNPREAISNYEIKHRFPLRLSWRKALFGDYETAANLFVERRSGRPYSYVFATSSNAFAVFGDRQSQSGGGGGNGARQLFYVPRDANDVILTGGLTWAALDAFIVAEGLDRYRGQIAPRNGFNSPWVTTADLQLRQELPGFFSGHKAMVTFDILNVANLLNKDWGRFEQVGFPFNVGVVQATGVDTATNRYIYSGNVGSKTLALSPVAQSVWRMQLGVRYQF